MVLEKDNEQTWRQTWSHKSKEEILISVLSHLFYRVFKINWRRQYIYKCHKSFYTQKYNSECDLL